MAENKKVVNAIVEARMGSTRLPGKTLLPIVGKTALGLLLERLRITKRVDNIIVATTVKPEDDAIERFCDENRIACFRGSSEDVLGRVYNASKKYKTDIIIEVTADCILLDPWLIDDCIEIFLNSKYDYLSNFIEQSYPPGIDVQIFTFGTLEEMNRLARDAKFREHVTLYILKHPEKYKMYNVTAPPDLYFPDWHLELDEPSDYELIKNIYESLYFKKPMFSTSDIIDLLKENPDWIAINKNVKRIWETARKEDIS